MALVHTFGTTPRPPGRLFPEIERIERERVNFGVGQHDNGGIGARTKLTDSNEHADVAAPLAAGAAWDREELRLRGLREGALAAAWTFAVALCLRIF